MKTSTGQRERILVIGDSAGDVRPVVEQAAPGVEITVVPTVFDGLAELVGNHYSAVLTCAEPIERRPEAAVRQLRELAGDSRLLMFGGPTLEPLSKKMLAFGVDDYFVLPATAGELGQLLAAPVKAAPQSPPAAVVAQPDGVAQPRPAQEQEFTGLGAVRLADVVLDAMLQHPGDATAAAIRRLNEIIAPTFRVAYVAADAVPPAAPRGSVRISHPVKAGEADAGEVHLYLPTTEEQASGMRFVTELAPLLGKVAVLQGRHTSLQKLAITDDLTGLYNGRYFRHFLTRILETAKERRSMVALSIFDIDDFKHYNDQFGHNVGDEILKQTATLIKRCVREHDHVARIGGDEFAVVFWEKEAPRQPHHEGAGIPGRPPQTPESILKRFQAMMAKQDLTLLGASGKGTLTISAGLAVYPWDASTPDELIELADKCLMFGAKKAGKNSVTLVGNDSNGGKSRQ